MIREEVKEGLITCGMPPVVVSGKKARENLGRKTIVKRSSFFCKRNVWVRKLGRKGGSDGSGGLLLYDRRSRSIVWRGGGRSIRPRSTWGSGGKRDTMGDQEGQTTEPLFPYETKH